VAKPFQSLRDSFNKNRLRRIFSLDLLFTWSWFELEVNLCCFCLWHHQNLHTYTSTPIFFDNPIFIVFTIMYVVALESLWTSMVMFLCCLTDCQKITIIGWKSYLKSSFILLRQRTIDHNTVFSGTNTARYPIFWGR